MSRALCLACVIGLVTPAAGVAQQSHLSRLAIDTVAATDGSVDMDGNYTKGMVIDAIVSVAVAPRLEAIFWPIVARASGRPWTRDIWIATLRYERPGRIGVRLEGGLLPAPIGLANLTVRRPHLNPTIAQPSSLFSALPPLELRGPRASLLGDVYPFGGQATVSGRRWDLRAAVIDTSPLRPRDIIAPPTNPPRFTNVVVGGGVTPFVGFRVGASVTHGGWMRAGESPTVTSSRDATVLTVESEFAFAFTKLAGEWVRDGVDTSAGNRVASGWFVQGQQTLAPRWFVAGRVERISSPITTPIGTEQRQRLAGTEEILGFRLTPEITLRAGHRARRGFGRPGYVHQATASLVWWKRWL